MGTGRYPSQYESWFCLKDGSRVFVRPVLESDKELLIDLFNRMSPESRYLRFMSHLHALPEELLYHFTHVDYDTEFALVVVVDEPGGESIIAVGRYSLGEENTADFAVAVRDDWQHLGIGKHLLTSVINIGKEHGISRYCSIMDCTNDKMKRILHEIDAKVTLQLLDSVFRVLIIA